MPNSPVPMMMPLEQIVPILKARWPSLVLTWGAVVAAVLAVSVALPPRYEATAALDPSTEAAIWDTVAKLRGRATVIAISHQPALARVADRIYRVEGRGVRRIDAAGASSEGAA